MAGQGEVVVGNLRDSCPCQGEMAQAEHVALATLWLPDKRTERAIGDLLPVIDLDAFGHDKDAVRDWLVSTAGLRTRIEQLTVEEWKGLLSTRMPDKAPAERLVSDERLRDKVTGWYAACLETVAEQEHVSQKAFASCPLLCRKADSWRYVAEEPRYLDDDNDLATAFAGDVWLFHVPARLAADAEKYLGVLLYQSPSRFTSRRGNRSRHCPTDCWRGSTSRFRMCGPGGHRRASRLPRDYPPA